MQTQRMKWAVGTIALFGSLVIAGTSYASCTGSNRLTVGASDCLDGSHTNTCTARIFGKCIAYSSSFEVTSQCEEKVVAKIDLAGATDRTLHLHNFAIRSGTDSVEVRGVYCCDDLGRCN